MISLQDTGKNAYFSKNIVYTLAVKRSFDKEWKIAD